MVPDLDIKGQAVAVAKDLDKTGNGSATQVFDDKLVYRASNCEGASFGVRPTLSEQQTTLTSSKGVDVNRKDCRTSSDNGFTQARDDDMTENSSSFDGTFSGDESGAAFSDSEIESELYNFDSMLPLFYGSDASIRRKKKLKAPWRTFRRPISWRCKWAELRMHEIKSQVSKYYNQLVKYDDKKQFEPEKFTTGGCSTKSPVSGETNIKVMKRRKRKRVEDAIDSASYMSQHNLFSYFDKKKYHPSRSSHVEFGCQENAVKSNGEVGIDGLSRFEFGNDDDSLEKIQRKIGVVKSRVGKLKNQISKVICENYEMFSSINLESRDALNTSHGSPVSPKNRYRKPVKSIYTSPQHVSQRPIGDTLTSEITGSSHGQALPDHNISMRRNPCHNGSTWKSTEGEATTVIRMVKEELQEGEAPTASRIAKEELQCVQKFESQMPQIPREEKSANLPVNTPESEFPVTSVPGGVYSNGKSIAASNSNVCQVFQRKRKKTWF